MANKIIVEITRIRGGSLRTHHAISDYEWVNHSTGESKIASRNAMVEWIEEDKANHLAYVRDRRNPKIIVYCGVNHIGTTKFLQTYADGRWTDNLLDLPQC